MRVSMFVRKCATEDTYYFLQNAVAKHVGQYVSSTKARLHFVEFKHSAGKLFVRELEQRIIEKHDIFILHCKNEGVYYD